jgi:hypothetical protein
MENNENDRVIQEWRNKTEEWCIIINYQGQIRWKEKDILN